MKKLSKPTEQLTWTWKDAWVLISVLYGGGEKKGADLVNILGAGDWINHSIFSYEELTEGLEKLIAIGLVKIKDNKFTLTVKFKREYARQGKPPRAVLKAANLMEVWLKETVWKARAIEPVPETTLSRELLEKAYQEYSTSMK